MKRISAYTLLSSFPFAVNLLDFEALIYQERVYLEISDF